ncbi:MAG: LuxR C-terminal-related transcriptional regulator, partial [Dehalococcoidia bacterium]
DGLKVVGEARDMEETEAVIEADEAQVVLLGATLAGSLPAPAAAFASNRMKMVLIIPANASPERVAELLALGAKGVVTNEIRMADLIRVLQLVSQDMVILPASATVRKTETEGFFSHVVGNNVRLAPREWELLQQLAQGFSEKEASELLGIGRRTIQTYLGRIRGKLGAVNRVHAVALAVAARIVSPHRQGVAGADLGGQGFRRPGTASRRAEES